MSKGVLFDIEKLTKKVVNTLFFYCKILHIVLK